MTLLRTLLVGFGLTVAACSGSSSTGDVLGSAGSGQSESGSSTSSGSSGTTSTPPAREDPPRPKLYVEASVIAATLGDDCGGGAERFAPGDCAPTPGGTGCSFACQRSNLQLAFKTGAGPASKVTVRSVTLHDAKTGKKLDTLDASSPQAWRGNGYVTWDEVLSPSSEVKATYELSAPAWSSLDGSYATQYRITVTLEIDGTTTTLESATLTREPAVAT